MSDLEQAAKNAGRQLFDLLKQHAIDSHEEAIGDGQAVADDAARAMSALRASVGQPGYQRGVVAERDSVALLFAGRVMDRGDSFDNKINGMIDSALAVGSTLLHGLAGTRPI